MTINMLRRKTINDNSWQIHGNSCKKQKYFVPSYFLSLLKNIKTQQKEPQVSFDLRLI